MKKHVLFILSILSVLSFTYSPLVASDNESSDEAKNPLKREFSDDEEWLPSKKFNNEDLPVRETSTRLDLNHALASGQVEQVVQDSPLLTLFPEGVLKMIIDRVDGAKDQYRLARSCRKLRDLVYSFPYSPHKFNNFMYAFCAEQPDQPRLRDRFVRDFFLDTVVGRWEFVATYGDPSLSWDKNCRDLFETEQKAGTNVLGTSVFNKCVTRHISRLKKFLLQQPEDITDLQLPWILDEQTPEAITFWAMKYLQLEIGNFRQLRTLRANHSIRAISPAIYMLGHLRELQLGGNELTALPANLGSISSLEVLDVQSNLLRALPGTFSLLANLREVNLSNNLFEQFPSDLLDIPTLEVVDLSNIDMNFGAPADGGYRSGGPRQLNKVSAIPTDVTRMKSLQRLILSGNPLEEIPRELAQIVTLRYLDICRSNIIVIPFALTSKRNLEIYTTEARNARHRAKILNDYPNAPEEWIRYDW